MLDTLLTDIRDRKSKYVFGPDTDTDDCKLAFYRETLVHNNAILL